MTHEDQKIAIAEACGMNIKRCPIHLQRECCGRKIPDFLGDLNAMHEAEKALTNAQRRYYSEMLVKVHPLHYDPTKDVNDLYMKIFLIANMTAAQRAEAFLKTIGKWKEHDQVRDGAKCGEADLKSI